MAFNILASYDQTVEPKRLAKSRTVFRLVMVTLIASNAKELADVKFVKYELPSGFMEPSSCSDVGPSFPIKVWAPGCFSIVARVFHKNGAEEVVTGDVDWSDGVAQSA